ncbi:PQQ-binding-like beta-propeller repeat protein, partial [Streptomyces sp. st170]|uniref:outer membrane protein assembly factor BamB family protein n=1 Tax=Streptomyces sp. st170 TaxID=1828058 RepID=UPI0015CF610C
TGSEEDTHVRAAPPVRRRWLPRARLVVAAAVLLLVAGAGAGAYAVWGGGGGDGTETSPRGSEAEAGGPQAGGAVVPWRTELRTSGSGTPVCAGAGGGGALYCSVAGTGTVRIDPADGRVVWTARSSANGTAHAPIVSGAVVLAGGPDGKLRAFDPVKGTAVRDTSLSAGPGAAFPAGDTLLAVADDGTVAALDGASGASRWKKRLAGHVRPDFALYDGGSGLAYAFEHAPSGASTLVTAVDAGSGRASWQRRLDGVLTPVSTAGAGELVLTAMNENSDTAALVRYAPASGAAARIALPFTLDGPQVVMAGDVAYLLGRGGSLLAVDTGAGDGAGAELWRLETGVGRASAPVLGEGGHLYFSAADGRLLAVDTERGALVGQTRARLSGGKLTYASDLPAPVVAGRMVVGAAPDGSVFAVDGAEPGGW